MSGDEEVLDDFPERHPITKAEFLVGHVARNQQMTGQLQVESFQKINHLIMEQLPVSSTRSMLRIDLILQCLSKRGPALKNTLHGNAEKYKPLLSRDALKAEDGNEYFRDKLTLHFVKGAYTVFLWRFYLFYSSKERKI